MQVDDDPPAGRALSGPRWQVRPLIELHWRDWGGDSVVLEARSTLIYHFDPLAAAVMACLEEQPHSVPELASALISDLQLEVDGEFLDSIGSIVTYFHELGWVAPISAR